MERSTAQSKVRGGKIKNLCILLNFLGQTLQDEEILKGRIHLKSEVFHISWYFLLFLFLPES